MKNILFTLLFVPVICFGAANQDGCGQNLSSENWTKLLKEANKFYTKYGKECKSSLSKLKEKPEYSLIVAILSWDLPLIQTFKEGQLKEALKTLSILREETLQAKSDLFHAIENNNQSTLKNFDKQIVQLAKDKMEQLKQPK